MAQRQTRRPREKTDTESSCPSETRQKEVTKKGEALKKDLGELLDEIDDILEQNEGIQAKNFVQRSGE